MPQLASPAKIVSIWTFRVIITNLLAEYLENCVVKPSCGIGKYR
jgi:hypothetical protein